MHAGILDPKCLEMYGEEGEGQGREAAEFGVNGAGGFLPSLAPHFLVPGSAGHQVSMGTGTGAWSLRPLESPGLHACATVGAFAMCVEEISK